MKTKATLIAVLITVMNTVLFAGNDREGNNESQAIVRTIGKNSVYQLVYLSTTQGMVTVNILDASGKTIMTDRINNKEDGFMRPYNFSSLSGGNYTIEVLDGKNTVKVPVAHNIKAVQPLNVTVKALATEKKYQLVMVGKSDEMIQVDILDQNNTLVYTDYVSASSSFSKVYDLNKVKATNFTFEVKQADKVITTEQF